MKNAKLRLLGTATLIFLTCGVAGTVNAAPSVGNTTFAGTIQSVPLVEHAQYLEERGYYYSQRSGCGHGWREKHGCSNDYRNYPHRIYQEDIPRYYEGYYEDEYIETEGCN